MKSCLELGRQLGLVQGQHPRRRVQKPGRGSLACHFVLPSCLPAGRSGMRCILGWYLHREASPGSVQACSSSCWFEARSSRGNERILWRRVRHASCERERSARSAEEENHQKRRSGANSCKSLGRFTVVPAWLRTRQGEAEHPEPFGPTLNHTGLSVRDIHNERTRQDSSAYWEGTPAQHAPWILSLTRGRLGKGSPSRAPPHPPSPPPSPPQNETCPHPRPPPPLPPKKKQRNWS